MHFFYCSFAAMRDFLQCAAWWLGRACFGRLLLQSVCCHSRRYCSPRTVFGPFFDGKT